MIIKLVLRGNLLRYVAGAYVDSATIVPLIYKSRRISKDAVF